MRIVYSEPLNKVFKRDVDIKKLKKSCKDFEEWLKTNKKKIIKIIEKETGLKFKNLNFPIFICENFPFRGISVPLIIRKMNKKMMIETLFHELIHIILLQNRKTMNYDATHKFINEKIKNIKRKIKF